jgi:hypothetical protein
MQPVDVRKFGFVRRRGVEFPTAIRFALNGFQTSEADVTEMIVSACLVDGLLSGSGAAPCGFSRILSMRFRVHSEPPAFDDEEPYVTDS